MTNVELFKQTLRKKYSKFKLTKYGREWGKEQLIQGLVVDIGELTELVMAKHGWKEMGNVDEKLAHELADCLWSIIVIADAFGIDLEKEFVRSMDQITKRLTGA